MAVVVTDPREYLADAVRLIRVQRHYEGCRCNQFRDEHREGFCNPQEAKSNRNIDALLDRIRGTQ